MKQITIAVAIFFLLIHFPVTIGSEYDANAITIDYTFEKPIMTKTQIDGISYDIVSIPGISNVADPGEPSLPVKGAYILLPPNTTVKKIEIHLGQLSSIGEGYNIIPGCYPVPLFMRETAKPPVPNEEIYGLTELFPGKSYSSIGIYYFRGYAILVLSLYPVQYIPATGELFYYSNITVSIETAPNHETNELYRNLEEDKLAVLNKVDNPDMVYHYPATITNQLSDHYDLLILTTNEFKNAFQPLKQAHEDHGIITEIKTLNDVTLFPNQITPEDIREFIKNEYITHGVEYVLLGGDADIIPAKMLYVFGLDEDAWPLETEMPSDLYYACLDGPFNYDGDDRWGEKNDGENGGDVDLLAEIYIGRACVDNENDVNAFVTKTIAYMSINLSEQYLHEILLAGEYLGEYGVASWGGNYLDQLVNGSNLDGYETTGIPSVKFNITRLYDRDWPGNSWPSEELIHRINKGVHIINHDGHSYYGYNMKLGINDVELFENDQYFFAYSVGCMAGGFDDPDGYDCFAEYLTVKTDHGAFAAIMNARYGFFWSYSTDGDGTRYLREFWDAVFGENIPIISKANQDSKEDNLYLINRSCMRWTYYELNLFGDPTVAFHISNPPRKPSIFGPSRGTPGEVYTYEITSVDPDGDDLYYFIEFENGEGYWTNDSYPSGVTITKNWSWSQQGRFTIRVRAKDIHSAESDWATLEVRMPYRRQSIGYFIDQLIDRFPIMFHLRSIQEIMQPYSL